ncbi:MAG: hypothetical protein U0234_24600 [Sandaracinus sp.]
MTPDRREAIDRMFRARLSWTLLGGAGLVGLTQDLGVAWRGLFLAAMIAAFGWLNDPLVRWTWRARRDGDPRWQPMAIGIVLRVVALGAVLAVSW